ncbi:MAG: undecaprenyl-phosphate glucose phosphotransferase [Lachnospiraceae bacterium]|nr:undecaprenyl-phosphate glucose phosphotransferase [Lachnospiraceae bacterium]
MIKDIQRQINRLRVFIDAIITAAAYLLAWYLKFASPLSQVEEGTGVLSFDTYAFALWFIVPGVVAVYYSTRLYSPKRGVRDSGEFGAIVKGNFISVAIFFMVLFVLNQPDFSRTMIGYFAIINIVLTQTAHVLTRKILVKLRTNEKNIKNVLLVGYSRTAEEYITRLVQNPQWGYNVKGVLDDEVPAGTTFKGVKVLGRIDNLSVILGNSQLEEIIITIGLKDYSRLENIVDLCEKSGVHTKFIPDYMSIIPTMPYTEDVQGLPVINIRYVPLTNPVFRFIKRTIDIIGALFGIIITSPIMLATAIAVKATSKGPIIYKQERVGLSNKTFKMYKFRSMKVQTEADEKTKWTTKGDPRVTKVGKFIRKTSIDELPQLFNILFGDMSLVGPRPERPQFVEKFKEEIPRYMIKHQVRPGLTGWAQINGFRGDTSIYKRIEYDLYYIENWTFWMDIKIIFLTFFVGFVNKNAY